MQKKFIPTWGAKSISDINITTLTNHNISIVLCDLDNTLAPNNQPLPNFEAINFKKKLQAANIEIIIVSNNKDERVKKYANSLNVRYIAKSRKPFAKNVSKMLANIDCKKEEILMIGDQFLTDIWFGNNFGCKTLIVEPLDLKCEFWWTKFTRYLDRNIRNKLMKNNLIKPISEA